MAIIDRGPASAAPPPGDAVFARIFAEHEAGLRQYCTNLLRDEHEASDVLQAAALRAMLAMRGGTRPQHERAWLFRIVHNEAVSSLRRRRPAVAIDAEALGGELAALPVTDPLHAVMLKERLDEMLDDVRALAPRARDTLLLRELEGRTSAEIAEITGAAPGAVAQALSDARSQLQADRDARAASCASIRELLGHADGRRRRGRTVRSHLRGCAACRQWQAEREPRRALGLLPGPLLGALRWIEAASAGGPATSLLQGQADGLRGLSRAVPAALAVVSAAAGTVGVGIETHQVAAHRAVRAAAAGRPTAAVARHVTPVRTALSAHSAGPATLVNFTVTPSAAGASQTKRSSPAPSHPSPSDAEKAPTATPDSAVQPRDTRLSPGSPAPHRVATARTPEPVSRPHGAAATRGDDPVGTRSAAVDSTGGSAPTSANSPAAPDANAGTPPAAPDANAGLPLAAGAAVNP